MENSDTMWEKIKKGLRDGAALSMEKIEEYTKIGKLKIEEMAANRKLERNYMDIGERVFELLAQKRGGDIADDIAVKKAVENIESIKEDLAAIAAQIAKIQEASRSGRSAAATSDDDDDISGI